MKRALILGSLSAIADATIHQLAQAGWTLTLVARDGEGLHRQILDLRNRGHAADGFEADLADVSAGPLLVSQLAGQQYDLVLIAFGTMPPQSACERDLDCADEVFVTNFAGPSRLALVVANHLEAQGHGVLAVLGSVAGDRGRQSNYVYGATKAGLAVLVEGINHRLSRAGGARAVLIKPGLVKTPMTAHLPKTGLLWSTPEAVSRVIMKACRTPRGVAYAPGFWRWIMLAVRALPSPIFHRTAL